MINVLVKEISIHLCRLDHFDLISLASLLYNGGVWLISEGNLEQSYIACMICWVPYSLENAKFLKEFSISFPERLISCQDTSITILQVKSLMGIQCYCRTKYSEWKTASNKLKQAQLAELHRQKLFLLWHITGCFIFNTVQQCSTQIVSKSGLHNS